ncbi:MAG TPA: alkaline phosphatase family protein, partial [Polyangiaceae bacterium]
GYYKTGDFTVTPIAPPDAGSDAAADDGGSDAGSDSGSDSGPITPPDAGVIFGSGFAAHDELDTPPPGWSNPDSDGTLVTPHADDQYCYGVNHCWDCQHDDWDHGKNDHFVTQNNPGGSRAFFYEDDTVIPFYYALANTFSIGDRYFCSVLSSTWPNRYFLMAGTSFGIGDNSACTVDKFGDPAPQIFLRLEQGGHSWKDYTDGPHMVEFFPNFGLSPDALAHYGSVKCDLMADIANGTLPDVSFVMGDEIDPESSDEGPSDLPGIGGLVVETIIRNLFKSPSWKDTTVFITYDENGGIADHVPPAPACAPDSYPAHDVNGKPFVGDFKTTGFRVPFIVVSPYTKAHYVSHTVYDHTSITRFIEARFGLPALTARDANATPPMEMFDFKSPPFMTPPSITATTTVPAAILQQCKQTMAPTSCDVPSPDQ